jgi:peptide/nickel transport system permease protein
MMALLADLVAPFSPLVNLLPAAAPGTAMVVAGAHQIGARSAEEICAPVIGGPAGSYYCGTFWLGTDLQGRDILSRIIHGARSVLFHAPLATLCAYLVGIAMGLMAGYLRGWVDEFLSFVTNIILSFPVLVLYIIIISTFGPSILTILLAIVFAATPSIMRIVRGLVLDLRHREYVFAAQTRGETALWIMLVEILPNARGPLIVDFCLRIGYVTITIGTLSFLGLGLQPPTPDWGVMINENRSVAMAFPYMVVFPCLAISSLVLGFNLLADGLREIAIMD